MKNEKKNFEVTVTTGGVVNNIINYEALNIKNLLFILSKDYDLTSAVETYGPHSHFPLIISISEKENKEEIEDKLYKKDLCLEKNKKEVRF